MPYPTREEVYALFSLLETPPTGPPQFFARFSPDVKFFAIGPPTSRHAAEYASKDAFMAGGFAKLSKAVRPPGLKFKIVDGIEGVTVDEARGRAAVMFDTVDTFTHSGVEYAQHYSWHVKFNEEGMVIEARAYLDHGYLESVLGTELNRLGIE
jgi:ketosteroid isomerase-like protein